MTPLIYLRCRNSEHQLAATPTGSQSGTQSGSPITWHDGRWAYCPLGAPAEHDWIELKTGHSLAELRSSRVATA